MKKLLTTTALVATLALSGMAAYAHEDMHGKGGHEGHSFFMDVLPKDKAAQFHETMKQAHDKNLVLIDQMHKLHEERRAILTAAKFDKDAFAAKNEEVDKFHATMHQQMKANMKEAFATAMGNLSQEDRQALAVAMEKMHHEHHGHWHHGEHGWGQARHDEHPMNGKPDKHADHPSES